MNTFKRTFLIAEIGVNHNGNLKRAFKLVKIAKNAGFDAVKFQTIIPQNLCIKNAPLANYQKRSKFKDQFKMLKKISLTFTDFKKLHKYCKTQKITFISTPFDIDSAVFLNNLGQKIFKISSGDLDNFLLLKKIKSFNKKIILSTGMSKFKEILKAVKFLKYSKKKLFILHCVSDYPTALKDTNLGFFNMLKKLGYNVGFSDHTLGFEASACTIAMGANIIEKHITLKKTDTGPDHFCSLEAKDCKNFVDTIRALENSISRQKKQLTNQEKLTRLVARKSIYSKFDLPKNTLINENNIIALRPKLNGISPSEFSKYLKKRTKKFVPKNSLILKKYLI